MRNLRQYLWASSRDEALRLLHETPGMGALLGGGAVLAARQDPGLDFVVDVSRLGLDRIALEPSVLHLGASASLESVSEDRRALAAGAGVLAQALARTRTQPWRCQATLAGWLLEDDPADLVRPVLLVLDTRAMLLRAAGGAPERLPVSEALVQARAARGLLLEFEVPLVEGSGHGFALELVARSQLDVPIVAVAAALRIEAGRVAEARIATTAVPSPARAPAAEAALRGLAPEAPAFGAAQAALERDIEPRDDIRASAVYRAQVARVLLARALRRAAAMARGTVGAAGAAAPRPGLGGGAIPTRHSPTAVPLPRTLDGRLQLEMHVNGALRSLEVRPGDLLLPVLRAAGLWSVKHGCESGECGACLVLVDGEPILACVLPAARAHGSRITTVEALGHTGALHPLQQSFLERGAVQCGYCTPAMLLAAEALLERDPHPGEAAVRQALAGVLCRCTGYVKPVEAILATCPERSSAPKPAGG